MKLLTITHFNQGRDTFLMFSVGSRFLCAGSNRAGTDFFQSLSLRFLRRDQDE